MPKELMFPVVSNREAHTGGKFNVVRRVALKAHFSVERGPSQDRPHTRKKVAKTKRAFANVGSLMRLSATIVDVHAASKGSKPLHGIRDHLLLVEELAKRTLEVPLFGH